MQHIQLPIIIIIAIIALATIWYVNIHQCNLARKKASEESDRCSDSCESEEQEQSEDDGNVEEKEETSEEEKVEDTDVSTAVVSQTYVDIESSIYNPDEFPPAEFFAEIYEKEEEELQKISEEQPDGEDYAAIWEGEYLKEEKLNRKPVHVSQLEEDEEMFVFYRNNISGKTFKGFAILKKQTETDVNNNVVRASILLRPLDKKLFKDSIVSNASEKKFYVATKEEIEDFKIFFSEK